MGNIRADTRSMVDGLFSKVGLFVNHTTRRALPFLSRERLLSVQFPESRARGRLLVRWPWAGVETSVSRGRVQGERHKAGTVFSKDVASLSLTPWGALEYERYHRVDSSWH